MVGFLLKSEAEAATSAVGRYGATLLHVAAANGHLAVIRILLQYEAILDQKDGDGRTALDMASRKGYIAIDRTCNKNPRYETSPITHLHCKRYISTTTIHKTLESIYMADNYLDYFDLEF